MADHDALIYAFLAAPGSAPRAIGWTEINAWRPGSGFLWIHLNRTPSDTREWLLDRSGLDPVMVNALLEEETRPRSVRQADGLLVILRGVNLNPGADPEDMVSIRAWIDRDRAITIRRRRLLAAQDIRERYESGAGPRSSGEFLATLADRLIDRMAPVLDDLAERLDDLEEQVLVGSGPDVRANLAALRRQTIALRRHIAPQRDVTIRLVSEPPPWMSDSDRAQLRETADHLTRYVEDLDALRERGAVTQEELTVRLADRMNRTMYVLSLVATVFLPLGFLTGLLGVNLGGIPGTDSQLAFFVLCAILLVIAGIEFLYFRRKKWL